MNDPYYEPEIEINLNDIDDLLKELDLIDNLKTKNIKLPFE